jgi:hypothetical protein
MWERIIGTLALGGAAWLIYHGLLNAIARGLLR